MAINYIINALEMKRQVIDKLLVPYREQDGALPIFSEQLQKKNGSDKSKKAGIKVAGVTGIFEAVESIRQAGHHWRLKKYETGQVNIFKPEHIVIREHEFSQGQPQSANAKTALDWISLSLGQCWRRQATEMNLCKLGSSGEFITAIARLMSCNTHEGQQ